MPKDLFYPSAADEKAKHKLKRLIQSPNSFFMDVKCPGCFHITTIFSHAQVNFPSFSFYARNELLSLFLVTLDCRLLPWLRPNALHPIRREMPAHRRLLVPAESGLSNLCSHRVNLTFHNSVKAF